MNLNALRLSALMGALVLTLGLGQTALAGPNGDRDHTRNHQNQQVSEYRKKRDSGHDYRRGYSRRDGYRDRRHDGGRKYYGKRHHDRGHHYGKRRDDHRYYYGKRYKGKGNHYGWKAPYTKKGKHYGHKVACHRVSRHGYWGGRPAKIGGLKCFDRYGRAYIKRGSHRVIQYYPPRFVFRGDGFSFNWR